ncbi:MAG: hypothetical protein QM497_06230 [Sulfurimonas sp.]
MFEYADPGAIIGLVLMPIASLMLFIKEGRYNYLHKTNKKGERTVATILLIGTVLLALYSSHSNKEIINTNIKAFKNSALLKCSNGLQDILAAKKNGWHLSKHTLYKDDYIVNIQRCSVLDKKDFKGE